MIVHNRTQQTAGLAAACAIGWFLGPFIFAILVLGLCITGLPSLIPAGIVSVLTHHKPGPVLLAMLPGAPFSIYLSWRWMKWYWALTKEFLTVTKSPDFRSPPGEHPTIESSARTLRH